MKTKILLEHFDNNKATFTFMPIDISEEAINFLVNDLSKRPIRFIPAQK